MRILRFLSILSVLPLAVECGLPRPYYLEPPTTTITSGTSPFSISNSVENNFDEFKGFEFYYRFYTTPNWSDYTGQTKETLEITYHFLPLCSPTDTYVFRTVVHSRPLVSITSFSVKQSAFTVTIDFSDPTFNSPKITASLSGVQTPTMVMRSAAAATASQIKIFTPLYPPPTQYNLYEALDPDMANGDNGSGTPGIPPGTFSTVYLVLYALSYGVFEGNPTFSTCVNLGYNSWSGSPAITVN